MVRGGRVTDIKMNSKGSVDILTHPAVVNEIRRLAEARAAAANAMDRTPETERGELFGYEASVVQNPKRRAHGRVTAVGPSARRRNARNNTLLRVLGGDSR